MPRRMASARRVRASCKASRNLGEDFHGANHVQRLDIPEHLHPGPAHLLTAETIELQVWMLLP